MGGELNKVNIAKGVLLLAEPFMMEDGFKRSVILMVEHTDEGSIGFILNKPLGQTINELIDDFPEIESPVFYGGPVGHETLHYIHDRGDVLDNSIEVSKGVYWSGDYEKLKFLIQSEVIKPHNIKFFVGYSGWSSGQLSDEMVYGSWIPVEMDPNYTFQLHYKNLWATILGHKGDVYGVIAQIPPDHNYN